MEYAMETTTTTTAAAATTTEPAAELYAEYIAAPASSMSPAAIAEHMQQNRITFEIPTARDLRHIDALHSFNALLQRIGNAAYDSAPASASASASYSGSMSGHITTEQLSNSVVLDLADLREEEQNNSSGGIWEQIFGDADMHALVNYLWIGVVTSLVILSLVFIIFSCYFYRKFRTWKKCNKDIRAQIHGAGSDSSYSSHGASHHLISCDASRLLQASSSAQGVNGAGGVAASSSSALATGGNEAAFYQIESPPCYTIATGLPSYAEALRHQPRHFAYGMRFMLPSLAAVHHHHHHQQQQHLCQRACIANWEKDAVQRSSNKLQKCKLSAADEATWRQTLTQTQSQSQSQTQTEDKASPAICINMPDEQQREGEQQEQQEREQHRNAAAETLLPAAAADDDCASLVVVVAA